MSKFPIINIIVLILLSAGLYTFSVQSELITFGPLLTGNVILFGISMLTYYMISRALKNDNPNVLVRAKMSGTIIKFFSVIGLVLMYVFLVDRKLEHKANVYTFVALYFIYMILEALFLSRLAHQKQA